MLLHFWRGFQHGVCAVGATTNRDTEQKRNNTRADISPGQATSRATMPEPNGVLALADPALVGARNDQRCTRTLRRMAKDPPPPPANAQHHSKTAGMHALNKRMRITGD